MGFLNRILHYKRVIVFTAIAALLLGIFSYYMAPKQEFPQINAPAAVITAIYPGASPSQVEKEVTRVLENEFIKLEGYDYSHSSSRNSVSVIVLRFDVKTDMEKAKNELNLSISKVRSILPQGVTEIRLDTDLVETVTAFVALSSATKTIDDLSISANELAYRILEVKGVNKVEISGDTPDKVVVEVNKSALDSYKLDMIIVSQILDSFLTRIPLGSYSGENEDYSYKEAKDTVNYEDFENLNIVNIPQAGLSVKLKNIATIEKQQEAGNEIIRINGKRAVLLSVYTSNDKNVIDVGENISKAIERYHLDSGKDVDIAIPFFSPDIVEDSVNNFNMSLLQGMLLVFVVIFLGMGFRNSLVVASALPLSVLFTFFIMYIFGIEFNQISIAALIISLGMVVDNAIVMSDSIQVKIDEFGKNDRAIAAAIGEVAFPVLSSTLTTVFAFMPLLMLSGVAGKYISSLPSIIIIALVVSYLVSIFYTPVFSNMFLKHKTDKAREYRFRETFSNILKFFLKRKLILGLLVLVFIAISIFAGMKIPLQFFPYADNNILYVDFTVKDSNSTQITEEYTESIEDSILQIQNDVVILSSTGDSLPKFYNTMLPGESGKGNGQLYIQFDKKKISDEFGSIDSYVQAIQNKVDAMQPEADVQVKRLEQGEPIGAPIRLIISNLDIDKLYEESGKIKNIVENIEGIEYVNDDKPEYEQYYDIEVNYGKLSTSGVNKASMLSNISIALGNITYDNAPFEDKARDVSLRLKIDDPLTIGDMFVYDNTRSVQFMLKDLATIEKTQTLPNLDKYNRQYSVTITAGLKEGVGPDSVEREIRDILDTGNFESSIKYDGELGKIVQYFGDIGILAVFALVLVFITLLVQFNSMKRVFVILLTIPLSVIGSVYGLYLFGQKLSFTSVLGIVSLMGIVVNNAIILIDFIDREIKLEHMEMEIALITAVKKRFRPIMLTTITTVFGLIPLVLSDSPLFKPMSIALLSGLLFSTILTLIVIPVFYYIMFSVKGTDTGRG